MEKHVTPRQVLALVYTPFLLALLEYCRYVSTLSSIISHLSFQEKKIFKTFKNPLHFSMRRNSAFALALAALGKRVPSVRRNQTKKISQQKYDKLLICKCCIVPL